MVAAPCVQNLVQPMQGCKGKDVWNTGVLICALCRVWKMEATPKENAASMARHIDVLNHAQTLENHCETAVSTVAKICVQQPALTTQIRPRNIATYMEAEDYA